MTLRDYQERDLGQVRMALRQYRSVLLVQPTGAGKGTLAAWIVDSATKRGKRVLFLVNRKLLVLDMSEERLTPLGIEHGVIMGDHPMRKPWASCHVCSIDTLARRSVLPVADVLIVDEARFAVTERWRKVLALYPNAKILGLDATPIREDGIGLGDIFEHMVQGPQVQELIDQKYLVPAQLLTPGDASVAAPNGKLNDKKAADVMDRSVIHGKAVESWIKHASGRKTVVFCQHKKHAHHVRDEYRSRGIGAEVILDDTPRDERRAICADLDQPNGNLTHIIAVGVVSYGWDHPIVSCIQWLAMTDSIARILQGDGRGSRPYRGKTHMLILDHCRNHHRNDILYEDDRIWSLTGSAYKNSDQKAPAMTMCRNGHTFRTGPDRCPFCGIDIKKAEMRPPKEVEAELIANNRQRKALSIEQWQKAVPEDRRKHQYFAWLQLAEERGHKSTYPDVLFNKIFGQWPRHSKIWRAEYERSKHEHEATI